MDAVDISKKEAQKAYNRAWYAKNKDFVAAKEWIDRLNSDGKTKRETTVLQTAEERKARKKVYHETVQKPKMMAAYRAKLAENPNLNREQYAKRAEYHKAWMRQWRIENPELAKAKDASDKVKFAIGTGWQWLLGELPIETRFATTIEHGVWKTRMS